MLFDRTKSCLFGRIRNCYDNLFGGYTICLEELAICSDKPVISSEELGFVQTYYDLVGRISYLFGRDLFHNRGYADVKSLHLFTRSCAYPGNFPDLKGGCLKD